MLALRGLFAACLAVAAASCATIAGPDSVQALAPTGKLRVALYLGAPTNIIRGATPNEDKGVGFDLGKDLARRMHVPFEPVIYPGAGAVMDGLPRGEWDISFLARTPERQGLMGFTSPFLIIEHGYLVPAGSPIAAIGEVDRPGVRIGAPQGGSVNAVLARTVRNATVVQIPGLAAAAEMLETGKVDVFAANKANLFELSDRLPGSHVLGGRIGLDEYAIEVPKGRESALPYLRQYLAGAKADGTIRAAIRRVGLRGSVDK